MSILKTRTTFVVGFFTALTGISILLLVPQQIPGESWNAIANIQSPAFFPLLNAVFLTTCGIALIFMPVDPGTVSTQHDNCEPVRYPQTLAMTIALLAVYLVMIRYVGMVVSSVILIAAMSVLLGYRNKAVIAICAFVFPVVVYFLFEKVLKILLPHEVIF